jgi:hypothetical protein
MILQRSTQPRITQSLVLVMFVPPDLPDIVPRRRLVTREALVDTPVGSVELGGIARSLLSGETNAGTRRLECSGAGGVASRRARKCPCADLGEVHVVSHFDLLSERTRIVGKCFDTCGGQSACIDPCLPLTSHHVSSQLDALIGPGNRNSCAGSNERALAFWVRNHRWRSCLFSDRYAARSSKITQPLSRDP